MIEQLHGIVIVQPDGVDTLFFDQQNQLGHAVDEGFAAEMADIGMQARIVDQMLAAAKADFKPIGGFIRRKQRVRPDRSGTIDLQVGQSTGNPRSLFGPQAFSLPATIKSTALRGFAHFNLAVSLSTRSSFSHEKPPSASGVRPK